MMHVTISSAALVLALTLGCGSAMPKLETAEAKSSVLEKGEYPTDKGDQLAVESQANSTIHNRPPRFGFPVYSTDVQGYSQTSGVVPGVYGPVKLDIGGLLLGTIVGLGAFFILPKLLHVAAPYEAYKRSEDETSETENSLTDMFLKFQDVLNKYNVDSTSCMQRAICYSIQAANDKTNGNAVNPMDNFIDSLAKNGLTKSLIGGTDWEKAAAVGESGGNCSATFPSCTLSLDGVASAVAKYLIS